MNKLTKVGLSALCGSLSAISAANAGDIAVSGGATMTYGSLSKEVTGNPLGLNTALSFKGSGELDGGQTFSLTLDNTDKNAWSAGSLELVTNSLGTFNLSQAGGGNGIGGYDDNMPTAWEEVWGAGVTVGPDLAKGVGSSMNLEWASPTFAGSTLQVAWAPRNDGKTSSDKGVGGAGTTAKQEGIDIVLDINSDNSWGGGFLPNVFLGYSVSEQDDGAVGAGKATRSNDHEEGVIGVKFSIGPMKLGIQKSLEHPANQKPQVVEYYANTSYGVSFNVNDNLSLSYAEFKSRKGFTGKSMGQVWNTASDTRRIEAESWQIAYTMGGASLKFADVSVDNGNYVSDGSTDRDGRMIALTLAF